MNAEEAIRRFRKSEPSNRVEAHGLAYAAVEAESERVKALWSTLAGAMSEVAAEDAERLERARRDLDVQELCAATGAPFVMCCGPWHGRGYLSRWVGVGQGDRLLGAVELIDRDGLMLGPRELGKVPGIVRTAVAEYFGARDLLEV